MKVMTIVGTRPEIIRLSRVIAVLDSCCEHVLVHTGQNYDYELNEIFFSELEIPKPKHFLNAVGTTTASTIGNIISESDAVMEAEKPDAVLVLGDTNSCLSVICAKRRKIPIFHMEAGNRCFDMRVPEEINRRIVDHIADINLCYSEHSRRHLLAEGLPSDRVLKTGSPMSEVLTFYKDKINKSKILSSLNLSPQKYIVASLHREENVDDPVRLNILTTTLGTIADKYNLPIIFSVHPRTRKRLESYSITLHPLINAMQPLGFLDFVKLQKNSFCTLSDSGTITEESSILKFPAVNLRETHERPEGMDEGAVILAGLSPERILESIKLTRFQYDKNIPMNTPEAYQCNTVSMKTAKIILSYTDYVNRYVWKRN